MYSVLKLIPCQYLRDQQIFENAVKFCQYVRNQVCTMCKYISSTVCLSEWVEFELKHPSLRLSELSIFGTIFYHHEPKFHEFRLILKTKYFPNIPHFSISKAS